MEDIQIDMNRVGVYDDIALLRLSGFVDTSTAPQLKKNVVQLINEGFIQLVIDLSGVQYVSSAGWGVFVGEIKNVREKGGDIKVTQMIPSVYEVFEMLEFNLILRHYDTIREAMYDYDYGRGINLQVIEQVLKGESPISEKKKIVEKKPAPQPTPTSLSEPDVEETIETEENDNMSLSDHVKQIVIENPMLGAWTITKKLKQRGFNSGFFEIRALLKTLGLDTKARRKRYYRSR